MLNSLSLFFYVLAFLLILFYCFKNKSIFINAGLLFTLVACILNMIYITLRWRELGYFPTVTFSDTLVFLAFIISAIFLLFYFMYKRIQIFIFILPFLSILILVALILNPKTSINIDKNSALLYIHLPFSITGTALFFLSAFAGIIYFYQEKQLKNKNIKFINRESMPLDSINKIINNLLIYGFLIFTIGLITGFIWRFYAENIEEYSYITKLVFSIITWCTFGLLLLIKKIKGLTPKKLAMGSIIGFVCLIITYIGLAIFLSGK